MSVTEAELTATVLRFAAQGVLRFLETSDGWRQLSLAEGQFHTGDDPIVADADAHKHFENLVVTHPAYPDLRVWGIVGEENIITIPSGLTPGARVIVLDPLDGSGPWAMIRAGYCVAALSLIAGSGGILSFECAIVAGPTHAFTLIGEDELHFGPTFARPADDVALLSAIPENELIDPSVALAGYKSDDRDIVVSIMQHLGNWSIITLGGNPVTPYVLVGGLTAAVTLRPQCTWDAVGILMCTATDAVVGLLDGTLISGRTFRKLFSKVVLTGNVRIIPAVIVAKNHDRFINVSEVTQKFVNRSSIGQ
jgi:hypothetical protein